MTFESQEISLPIETTNESLPLDLPEPWATQLRELAKELGEDPEALLSRIVAQQLALRQSAKRLAAPWMFVPPRA